MKRLISDVEALKTAERTFDEHADAVMQRARTHVEEIESVKRRIANHTEKYLHEGIAYIPADLQAAVDRLCIAGFPTKLSTYFRDLAKELDRPRLIAQDGHHGFWANGQYQNVNYIHLGVPRQNRLKNIVSHLLLVAVEGPPSVLRDGHALSRDDTNGMWNFYFNKSGTDGVGLFEDLRERCHTDPVFRIVLRLA
jgi:hypothetical protein